MFSSSFLPVFVLLGNAFAFPHFPVVARDAATCSQDNLLRCFINTKSTAAASALCAALTPFTQTVATVTASAATTTTTTVIASTETDGVTVLITSTVVLPVVASTVYVGVPAVQKRSVMAPPNCFTAGTTYPASRVTSACACIGVAASTVLGYTYTASTSTATIVSTQKVTITTSTTTTSTALETDFLSLTTTLTTTSPAPTPTVCGAPSANNIVSNPSFECGTTLSPWTVQSGSGDMENIVNTLYTSGSQSLHTSTSYYVNYSNAAGGFSQILATVPGKQYLVSFDMRMDGGGGNQWTVTAGGTIIKDNSNGVYGDGKFSSYSGNFVAATTSDILSITYTSTDWAYADWEWDNFVVSPL